MNTYIKNVKEKSNNILILAILFTLGIYFIFGCISLGSDLFYCITGEEGYSWSEDIEWIIESSILMLLVAITIMSVIMAGKGKRKLMVVAIVILAGLMIYNMSPGMLNCLVLAIVWNKNAMAESPLDDDVLLKTTIILAVISFVSTLLLPLYGMLMMLLSPANVDMTWMLFVFGSQLMSFVIKPELIVMVYLFRKSKGCEDDVHTRIRKAGKIYFALWTVLVVVMLLADLTQNGVLSQWFGIGGADVEAGDWSEWETE